MSKQIVYIEGQETKKSKYFQRYQKLLIDIASKKVQQENLSEGMRTVIPKIQSELQPLLNELMELHIQKLIRLDEVVNEIVITKSKFLIFEEYILGELEDLLSGTHKNNSILQDLYLKYNKEKYEEDRTEQDFISELIKSELGIDVDPDEIIEKGFEQYMADNQEKFEDHFHEQESKKKSKKQTKRQKEEEEEVKILALDAKAIYFRLIKKYHPDRQLDPAKQNEYTEITKLVTKAYKENDFMTLLKLQITYLEENELDASTLADDMLLRYNKILQAQLQELNQEIDFAKRNSMGLFEDFFDKNYCFSSHLFDKHKSNLNKDLKNKKGELEFSKKQKKGWFKECLLEMQDMIDYKSLRFHLDSMYR